MKSDDTATAILLGLLDTAYDRRSWHGTNLKGSIRGLSSGLRLWRPAAERNNIHELVLHCAYWKYTVCRRLTHEKRGSFPWKGSDWFPVFESSESQWRESVALLEDQHRRLRSIVESLPSERLMQIESGSRDHNLAVISGVAAHDTHHGGQIQLIKRLYESRSH